MQRDFLPSNDGNIPHHGRSSGFTLIELLIVIAVLGILATIAVPVYLGQRTKAARTEGIAALESIRLLEEAYMSERGCYYQDSNSDCDDTNLVGTANIRNVLRGFAPGNNPLFDYRITYSGTGTQFTATATGRSGTTVDGTVLTIDQDNNKNY